MTASSSIGQYDALPTFSTRPFILWSHIILPPSRVVPDFLVQTGDRTGTGAGGESFFGGAFVILSYSALFPHATNDGVTIEQFEDEIHPRLRYAHRGLVAMANNGAKNSNDSQFIITLGASVPHFTRFLVKSERVCVSLGMG